MRPNDSFPAVDESDAFTCELISSGRHPKYVLNLEDTFEGKILTKKSNLRTRSVRVSDTKSMIRKLRSDSDETQI